MAVLGDCHESTPKYISIEMSKLQEKKAINLALQGSGSHSAFTWGVLDRLLEDERLTFDGITATGAGSINAVVLADGLALGGREAAKKHLEIFWRRMSEIFSASIIAPSFFDKMNSTFGLEHSPGYLFVDFVSRFMSPYQLNPFDLNPLRNLLNEIIDFQHVRRQKAVKLFLSATSVRTGKIAIFRTNEITADHVIASDCMPFRTRAPEINGEHYWDGGFMGNPAIFPVIYECDARDVLLIQLTPAERTDLPTSARAILDRMEEIVFNAALMREMRVIAMITQMIDDGRLSGTKRMFFHLIEAEDITRVLSASSKMNLDWNFLMHLFAMGRARAEEWLTDNFKLLGVETTLDLHSRYL
jgi:NTE family protein